MEPHAVTDLIADAVVALRTRPILDVFAVDTTPMEQLLRSATPVNVTPIHDDVLANNRGLLVYEESIVRPPWDNVVYAHVAHLERALVYLAHVVTLDNTIGGPFEPELRWESTEADHVIDWDAVRYISTCSVYAWRPGDPGVTGPLHWWKWCATDDGVMEDLYEQYLSDRVERDVFTNNLLAVLHSLTFLNCRNVTLVEPNRPRAQRRRLDRAGVRLSEIHVFPSGVTVRGRTMPVGAGGKPLHSVRGHVARYGPRWGRGLLFGKHEGEFWVPQHARGSSDHGTTDQHVTLERTPS